MILEREIPIIKERSKESLCGFCKSFYHCNLTSNQAHITSCSEYDRENFLLKMEEPDTCIYEKPEPDPELNGLCVSCENKSNCSLMQAGTITFYCQHYQ